MGAALVQQKAWQDTDGTMTFTSSVTAGSLLVFVGGGTSTATITAISDSVNGSWTRAVQGAGSPSSEIWYKKNAGAGSTVVTVTVGRLQNAGGDFQEFSGCATTGGADASGANANTSTTTPVTGSITPSASALIVAGCTFTVGTYSSGPTNSYTRLTNATFGFGSNKVEAAYKVGVTGSTSTGWTLSSSGNQDTTIAAFLEPATGGGRDLLSQGSVLGANLLGNGTLVAA